MSATSRGIIRPARRPIGWIARGPAPAGPQGRIDLEPTADEDLCFLSGDWRLFQKQHGHRWSLDDLITAWVATRNRDVQVPLRALDLGCGLGSVLLMLAWRLPCAIVDGIEAQLDRAAMGRRSIAYNGVEHRCRIADGDLRDRVGEHCYDLITGTPPYFPRGAGTESQKAHATPCRFEVRGGVEDYLAAAKAAATATARITICSAALERDRVAAAIAALQLAHCEQWSIIPRDGKDALVMVDVVSLGAPTVKEEYAVTVRDRNGAWTQEFKRVRDDMGLPSMPPRNFSHLPPR